MGIDRRAETMTAQTDYSIEMFSRIVEAIYTAALDPPCWDEVARLVSTATDSVNTAFVIQDFSIDALPVFHAYALQDRYVAAYMSTQHINPMMPSVMLSQPGDVLAQSAIEPEETFIKSEFYRVVAQPLGLRDAMGVVCLRSGPRFAFMAAARLATRPLYDAADLAFMRLLAPHFCRALTISDTLDLRTVKSDALAGILDGLVAGVFMLDHAGRVLHQNTAAMRIAADQHIVRIHEGRLWPVNTDSRDAFHAALARPIESLDQGNDGDASIALRPLGAATGGMIATLLPLAGRAAQPARAVAPFDAHWAAFIQDPLVGMPMPGEAFAKLYALTPAELRVALALAQGLPLEEVAAMLGIGMATVRTHLQRLFKKTGTARQTELVVLMMSGTAPTVAAQP
jgi:DNA-binding CsgD family transcriptional regulator